MNGDELRRMLDTWKAPPAPDTLRERVFPRRWNPFHWFLSGEIRVPAPVALMLLFVLTFVLYRALRPPAPSLS